MLASAERFGAHDLSATSAHARGELGVEVTTSAPEQLVGHEPDGRRRRR